MKHYGHASLVPLQFATLLAFVRFVKGVNERAMNGVLPPRWATLETTGPVHAHGVFPGKLHTVT
jgi:hypothetical protein